MAKILFVIVMLLLSPIWLPIMIVFGFILGPVGYAVLYYQRYYADYLYEKGRYNKYLILKKAGRWKDEFENRRTGKTEKNTPPMEPQRAALSVMLKTAGMFIVMFLVGFISGPFRAVAVFWRRAYFMAFPDEILVRREADV